MGVQRHDALSEFSSQATGSLALLLAVRDGDGFRLKKIDAMRNEIIAATQSVDSVEDYGRSLEAKHPEFRQHIRNGLSYEEVGQSHLEEQLRVYFAYTLDMNLWQVLVEKTERFSKLDRKAMAPMFSTWGFLHSDLVENIGEGLGWNHGSQPRNLEAMEFPTRMRLFVSTMEAFSDAQLVQFGNSLGLEEGVAPARNSGCYVATAVYGSYDAPEVLVLRHWRDTRLKASTIGRNFIRFYYATSPHLVKTMGSRKWFIALSRAGLDPLVRALKESGFSERRYEEE